jgi:hypothetical protein
MIIIFLFFNNLSEIPFVLGWVPVDLGPMSLDEIKSLLTKCKVKHE